MKNPAFLFISLAGTFEGFSTSGMATFLPKLIQNQFGTSAAWAAILSGKTRISLAIFRHPKKKNNICVFGNGREVTID